MDQFLKNFFEPEVIALLGASRSNALRLGNRLIAGLFDYEYGGKMFIVHPAGGRIPIKRAGRAIDTIQTLKSVSAIPDQYRNKLDIAVICFHRDIRKKEAREDLIRQIQEIVDERAKFIMILSGGFGEVGSPGKEVEKQILSICEPKNVRIVGPNCMGFLNSTHQTNVSFFDNPPKLQGSLGVCSQSGALAIMLLDELKSREMGVSKLVSVGNMIDLSFTDVLKYYGNDHSVKVIGLLVEHIDRQKVKDFVELCRRIVRKKPIVVFKVGRTESGLRASETHSGSLHPIGMDEYQEIFREANIIVAEDSLEFIDALEVFEKQPIPRKETVGIITISGGPAIVAADCCDERGLKVPILSEKVRKVLRGEDGKEVVSMIGSIINPVDMTPRTKSNRYPKIVNEILGSGEVGMIVAINMALDRPKFGDAFVNAAEKYRIPIVAHLAATPKIVKKFRKGGIPVFSTPERCVKALEKLTRYARIACENDGSELMN